MLDPDDARPAQHLLQEGNAQASPTSTARRSACRRPRPRTRSFPAYGAQPVHMPFGEVYTSLQTGVVDIGRERRQRLPLEQALRGRAGHVVDPARGQQQPALGQRQDLGRACSAEQKGWVEQAAAAEVGKQEPAHALEVDRPVGREARADRRQAGRERRQVGLHRSRRRSRTARQGVGRQAVRDREIIRSIQ